MDLRRGQLVMVMAALTLAAWTSSAQAAGTVTGIGTFGNVEYTGDASVNNVTVSDAPGAGGTTAVTLAETGISLVATPGCADNGNSVTCTYDNFFGEGTEMTMLAGNDVVTFNTSLICDPRAEGGLDADTITGPITSSCEDGPDRLGGFIDGDEGGDVLDARGSATRLSGGDGEDVLRGGDGDDGLNGDAGNDQLTAGNGDDELNGGEGTDVADGEAGADEFFESLDETTPGDGLRGGPGFDEITLFSVAGPGGRIDLQAGTMTRSDGTGADSVSDFEDATGGEGDDTILGSAGANVLDGAEGNDLVDGREGGDNLVGSLGNDRLEARDGVNDRANGATGTDTCVVDQFDQTDSCEDLQLAQTPPFGFVPPPDTSAPTCVVSRLAGRPTREKVVSDGISLRLRCNETGRADVSLLGKVRRGRRLRLAAVGDLVLATRRPQLVAGRQSTVRLRIVKRFRRALGGKAKLRIAIAARDSAGNTRRIARRVRVR